MDSFSLHANHDFVTDRFRIYVAGSSGKLDKDQEFVQQLLKQIRGLPSRFQLVIIDAASALITLFSSTHKIDFLYACKELCGQGHRTIVLVVDTHAFDSKTLTCAYAISDYCLKLRSRDVMLEAGQVDTRAIKILEVTKLHGAECPGQGGIKFEIKPKVGIQILTFVTVKV